MILPKTKSTSHPCWICSPSRTSTSGKAGHTVTGMGKHLDAKSTIRQINFKRNAARRNMTASTTDSSATRPSLRWIILEMDQLASEDHSHIATEEIDVYRGNWWIRSNVVNFDTMPTRHQPDFKKALSTLYRLKKAEDEKQYAKWSQSSSSWWQWQTNWWESDYENSPQRWGDH